MQSKSWVEEWIATSAGALEMTGALNPSDTNADPRDYPQTDHVVDVPHTQPAAIPGDERLGSRNDLIDTDNLGTTWADRIDNIDQVDSSNYGDRQDASPIMEAANFDLNTKERHENEDGEGKPALDDSGKLWGSIPSEDASGDNLSGEEGAAYDRFGSVDDQSTCNVLMEASRRPLPASFTRSEALSSKFSLDVLLTVPFCCPDDPSKVPILPSISTSTSEEERQSFVSMIDGREGAALPQPSLEILLCSNSPAEHAIIDPGSIPLPSSTRSCSERSSLRTLLKHNPMENPTTKRTDPPYTYLSSSTSAHAQSLPRLFDDYAGFIKHSMKLFPHLKKGNMKATEKRTRHNKIDISCIDYEKTSGFYSPDISVKEKDQMDRRSQLKKPLEIFKWSHLPGDNVRTRLLVVQDLSPRTVSVLGQVFGMNPEFFEEHLVNSGYRGADYNEPSPSTWNSAGMSKHYYSVRWFRPVSRLHVPPFSVSSQVDLLKSPGARLDRYTDSEGSFSAETNIFRSDWSLSTEFPTPDRQPIGWEERATLFRGKQIQNCYFVVLLLDPLPTLVEEIKNSKLRKKEGGGMPLPQQSRPAQKRLTKLQKMKRRMSKSFWERSRTRPRKNDTENGSQRAVERVERRQSHASSTTVSRYYRNEVERGERTSNQKGISMRNQGKTRNRRAEMFTRIASIPIFEQSVSRVPLASSDYDYSHFGSYEEFASVASQLREKSEEKENQDPNKAKSTREDFIERLLEVQEPRHDLFGHLACTEPLILLIIRDTSHFLSLIHRALDDISRDILDDGKMEASLPSWRQLLYRCQRELPDIDKSIRTFIKFCTSTSNDKYDSEAERQMEKLEKEIDLLLKRVDKVSSSLISNMALLDSKRGIAEAESVTKLTELAFLFIPLSFASSIFGMQITIFNDRAPLSDFIAVAILIVAFSYGLRLLIRSRRVLNFKEYFLSNIRSYSEKRHNPLRRGQPIPTSTVINWILHQGRELPRNLLRLATYSVSTYIPVLWAATGFIVLFLFGMALLSVIPLAIIWTRPITYAKKSIITVAVLLSLLPFVLVPLWQTSSAKFRAGFFIMIRQSWLAIGLSDNHAIAIIAILVAVGPLVELWRSVLAVGAKIALTFATSIFVYGLLWILVFVIGELGWLPEPSPLIKQKHVAPADADSSDGSLVDYKM